MRTIIIGPVLLAVATAANSQAVLPDRPVTTDDIINCVDVVAPQFSRAVDAADLIADATVGKCGPTILAYVGTLGSTQAETSSGAKLKIIESLENAMKKRALMRVIEARSKVAAR